MCVLRFQSRRTFPRGDWRLIVDVDDPARRRMVSHWAIVDDRVVVSGHAVLLGHGIGSVSSGRQLPADRDFIVISVVRTGLAIDVSPQRFALLQRHGTGRNRGADGYSGDNSRRYS